MKVLRLPFGYTITLDREKPTDLGGKLMSIDIRERGACVNLAVPMVAINPRAILLAAVHQETYIQDFHKVSAMNDVQTSLWNDRALKYRGEGDPMAYTRAFFEVVDQKRTLTSESDKDVS